MMPRRVPNRPVLPVFVDTSAFYAFADGRDDDHAETHVLLKARVMYYATKEHALKLARQAIESIYQSAVIIEPVTPDDERTALRLRAQYADQDFSFTDATSFAVMRRLGIAHAFSFDSDFTTAGFSDIRHIL